MGFRHVVLLIALLAPFGSAYAQHPLVLNRLNEWNEAEPVPSESVMKAEVRKKAEEIYGATAACANSGLIVDNVEPASGDRYAFNGILGRTLKNAWFVTVRMPVCEQVPVRYMVMRMKDNSLKTIRVNRGVSHAWESLISDTLPSAQVSAIAAIKREGSDCSDKSALSLGVIRIESEEPSLGAEFFGIRYEGSWTEVWPIKACGRTVEVQIRFTADGDGGAFTHIPGDRVRVLP